MLAAVAANAQGISIGGVGGAPFTDVVNNATVSGVQSVARSVNFTIGPALQVNLPAHLRIEVDVLFRPYSFNLTSPGLTAAVSAQQWRFPVLAEYRFGKRLVTPYVEGGLSFDRLSGLSAAAKSVASSGPGALLHQSDAAVVLGAGAEFKIPALFRVSGELRFTRPTVSNFASISNLNQAEVLFGVHF